jgi:hypothetical protein
LAYQMFWWECTNAPLLDTAGKQELNNQGVI